MRLERAGVTANRKASAAADELRAALREASAAADELSAALREASHEVNRLQRGVKILADNSGPNREHWALEDLHFVATDLVKGGPGV